MAGDGSVPSAPFNGPDKVIPFNRRHGDFGMRKIFKDKLNIPSFFIGHLKNLHHPSPHSIVIMISTKRPKRFSRLSALQVLRRTGLPIKTYAPRLLIEPHALASALSAYYALDRALFSLISFICFHELIHDSPRLFSRKQCGQPRVGSF